MNSPTIALIWEIFRRGRLGLVLILLFAAASLLVSKRALELSRLTQRVAEAGEDFAAISLGTYAQASNWREAAIIVAPILFGLSFLILCALFTRVEPSLTRGFTGMPTRLFTLPIPSWKLAIVPIVVGAGAVTVLWWIWATYLFPLVLPPTPELPGVYFNLVMVVWLVSLQAFVWSLPHFPWVRTLLITVLVFAGICSFLLYLEPWNLGRRWGPKDPEVLSGLAIYGLAMTGLAGLGVSMTRRGRWQGWGWIAWLGDRFTRLLAWRRHFESGEQAQFCLEFRRSGLGSLSVLAVWCGLFLWMMHFWGQQAPGQGAEEVFLGTFWFGTLIPWAIAVGVQIGLDPATRRAPLSSFVAVRPLSTGALFVAKLKALVWIWIAGVFGSLVLLTQYGLLTGSTAGLSGFYLQPNGLPEFNWLVGVSISFNLAVGFLPLWLTGRLSSSPIAFLLVILGYLGLGLWLRELASAGSPFEPFLEPILVTAVALKLLLATVGFYRAVLRGLLTRLFVFGWVLAWLLVVVVFVGTHLSSPSPQFGLDSRMILWLGILSFPVVRIAVSPAALAMNRHR